MYTISKPFSPGNGDQEWDDNTLRAPLRKPPCRNARRSKLVSNYRTTISGSPDLIHFIIRVDFLHLAKLQIYTTSFYNFHSTCKEIGLICGKNEMDSFLIKNCEIDSICTTSSCSPKAISFLINEANLGINCAQQPNLEHNWKSVLYRFWHSGTVWKMLFYSFYSLGNTWHVIVVYFTKMVSAEKWHGMVRFSRWDLSHETDSGPKMKTL